MRQLLSRIVLALVVALPATASSETITRLTGEQLLAILGDLGYTGGEIDEDGDVVVRMSGYRVLLLLGSYKGESLMARFAAAGTAADCAWANDWNREMRLARVYLDAEGDPVLEAEIAFEGGIERANLAHFLTAYGRMLELFLLRVPRKG